MAKFKVLREHLGDKAYKSGDTREAIASDVAHLVRSGVLEPLGGNDAEGARPQYTVGPLTAAALERVTGLTDMTNIQAVLDAFEEGFAKAQADIDDRFGRDTFDTEESLAGAAGDDTLSPDGADTLGGGEKSDTPTQTKVEPPLANKAEPKGKSK